MKLNRAWLVAAAAVLVGSVAVVGCHRADVDDDGDETVTTEQASASGDEAAVEATSTDVGVEPFARGGGAHGGARGGAHGVARGRGHAGARAGWGHAGWGWRGRWDGFRRAHRYHAWW